MTAAREPGAEEPVDGPPPGTVTARRRLPTALELALGHGRRAPGPADDTLADLTAAQRAEVAAAQAVAGHGRPEPVRPGDITAFEDARRT